MFKAGKVINFFENISTAIVLVDNPLSKGDKIKFVRNHEELFEQKLTSLKINHQEIETSKKGQMVNIKTEQKVDKDDEIFKIQ